MGEEPERLRARKPSKPTFRDKIRGELDPSAHADFDALCKWEDELLDFTTEAVTERGALLAEVERLARERDGAQLALESNAPLILDLTAEVERLADERDEAQDKLKAREELAEIREVFIPSSGWQALEERAVAAETDRDEYAAELAEVSAQLVADYEMATECERLAGRVAALETIADKARAWVRVYDGQTTTHIEWRNTMQSLRIALADVGGSE